LADSLGSLSVQDILFEISISNTISRLLILLIVFADNPAFAATMHQIYWQVDTWNSFNKQA